MRLPTSQASEVWSAERVRRSEEADVRTELLSLRAGAQDRSRKHELEAALPNVLVPRLLHLCGLLKLLQTAELLDEVQENSPRLRKLQPHPLADAICDSVLARLLQ